MVNIPHYKCNYSPDRFVNNYQYKFVNNYKVTILNINIWGIGKKLRFTKNDIKTNLWKNYSNIIIKNGINFILQRLQFNRKANVRQFQTLFLYHFLKACVEQNFINIEEVPVA